MIGVSLPVAYLYIPLVISGHGSFKAGDKQEGFSSKALESMASLPVGQVHVSSVTLPPLPSTEFAYF